MGKIYRSAMGKPVDMDLLRLANENAVAIGNMRTNARGDELGPGGKVIKTKNQIIQEYNKMTGQVAEDTFPGSPAKTTPVATPQIVADEVKTTAKSSAKPRGSMASTVAKETDPRMDDIEDIDGGV